MLREYTLTAQGVTVGYKHASDVAGKEQRHHQATWLIVLSPHA